jgi:hypothetical protein
MASGSVSATSSTSIPPIFENIAAVEHERRVVLLVDLARSLHVELVHGEALDVHAEDRPGLLLGLLAVMRELDAARLAAPPDQDLRLDHARVPELLGGGDRFLDGLGGLAVGDRDAMLSEELLALILEQIHGGGQRI